MLERIKGNSILNIIFLIALILSFFILFKDPYDFLRFNSYFLLLLIGGFGFLNIFDVDFKNSILHLGLSLLFGILLNGALFLLLNYFRLNTYYSIILVSLFGLIMVLFNFKKAKMIISGIEIHKDQLVVPIVLLVIFSFFLISDNIYYLKDSIVLTDPATPTLELNYAASLDYSLFPARDLSYQGKELRYHFGYPIIVYQLVEDFHVDKLSLTSLYMQAFGIIVLVFLLNELSKPLKKNSQRLLLVASIFFSSLTISIVADPPFSYGLLTFTTMGNYSFVIMMLLCFFALVRLEKRSFWAEGFLLTAIALVKITFFIPLAICYFITFFLESLIRERDFKGFLMKCLMLAPGLFYLFLFTTGTHAQNLWVIFPGKLNLISTTLNKDYLFLNAIASLFLAVVGYFGLGLAYIGHIAKRIIKNKFVFSLNDPKYFFLLLILISYSGTIFLSEPIDGNNLQFQYAGYFILALLTFNFLFAHYDNKLIAALLILLLAFNFSIAFYNSYFYNSAKLVIEEKNPGENNLFANMKLYMVDKVVSIANARDRIKVKRCAFPKDLANGLELLSKKGHGTLAFSRLHETCPNYGSSVWSSSTNTGFVRTALSQKQAVIENHQAKGVVSQQDYCDRNFENLMFFAIITGNENKFGYYVNAMSEDNSPKFEDFSYYGYLRHFSNNGTYYIANEKFYKCMQEKPTVISLGNGEKLDYIKGYIAKNNIRYIMLERKEFPLEDYVVNLSLKLIYSSETVKIYEFPM